MNAEHQHRQKRSELDGGVRRVRPCPFSLRDLFTPRLSADPSDWVQLFLPLSSRRGDGSHPLPPLPTTRPPPAFFPDAQGSYRPKKDAPPSTTAAPYPKASPPTSCWTTLPGNAFASQAQPVKAQMLFPPQEEPCLPPLLFLAGPPSSGHPGSECLSLPASFLRMTNNHNAEHLSSSVRSQSPF